MATIRCEPLQPRHWPDVEKLFGPNGACAGCWCMFWRLPKGEPFDKVKGMEAKRRFKVLVETGEAQGVLAYRGSEPVGWCAMGPRTAFARLNRAPSLRCDDAAQVHSLPCFFVHRSHRGSGVARALLRAAVSLLKKDGVRIVEGYPISARPDGAAHPAAFAYTGTESMFAAEGFKHADKKPRGKRRMRKYLRRSGLQRTNPDR